LAKNGRSLSLMPMKTRDLPHFIYICGCDGTGKTTLAQLTTAEFKKEGIHPIRLWLRFPFFFSIPFLVYARKQKYSKIEVFGNVSYGYWEFQHSFVLREIFPWFYFLDAFFAAVLKVFLPLLFGKTIVCERFVLDMLIDVCVSQGDFSFAHHPPGIFFSKLLPRNTYIKMIDLDYETILQRRPTLAHDHSLSQRLAYYRQLASQLNIETIENKSSKEGALTKIWQGIRP